MPEGIPTPDQELADRAFKALASRPRRRILLLLAKGENPGDSCCGPHDVCSCTFSEILGLSPSTISHHMKVLQEAGIVTSRKEGLWVYYQLQPAVLAALAGELGSLLSGCCEPADLRRAFRSTASPMP